MANSSGEAKHNIAFALLAAIVAGDAAIEDGLAELRSEGIESLDEMLSLLRQNLRERERDQTQAVRSISLQRTRRETSPERVARIVQRVPEVPFILNGVTYEPEDITRFNGQELHSVAAPAGDHMLVVDDRELIERWWQFSYLERYRQSGDQLGGRPSSANGAAGLTREFHPRTWFFEHIDMGGSSIYLDKDRGYYDLTKVSLDWPFGGDWNDTISSYWMIGTGVAVLHDDIHWTGQTHSTVLGYPPPDTRVANLNLFGWNDRASSLETW
jgi:hypothetical protein